MAKAYNVGDRLYLPVWITNKESNLVMYKDNNELVTDAKFSYVYSQGETRSGEVRYGEPDLLLTAEEIYASRRMVDEVEHLTDMLDYGRKKYDEIEELKSRNAELEAILKEVMATRDEAIKQNDELIAENKRLGEENLRLRNKAIERTTYADNLMKENEGLKGDCNEWKDAVDKRIIDIQTLTAERDNLKADLTTQKEVNEELKAKIAELTAWYEEANKTATEAAEANDELKAKIADLRNRVGEQLAQIQDLNAEVHFLKEKGGKQTEEATKHAHVVLNDGTELAFTQKDTIAFYRDDVDMLFISDGDGVIAGFNRGDKPFNFAYFY